HEADRRLELEREGAERRHRRLLWLLGGAAVLLALMAGVTVFALAQRSEANHQTSIATEATSRAKRNADVARRASRRARANLQQAQAETARANQNAANAQTATQQAQRQARAAEAGELAATSLSELSTTPEKAVQDAVQAAELGARNAEAVLRNALAAASLS